MSNIFMNMFWKKIRGGMKGILLFAFYIKNNLLILCFVLLFIWELQISNNFTPKYCFQSFCWIFIYITMTCSWAIKNKKRKGIFSYEKWKLSPAHFWSKIHIFFENIIAVCSSTLKREMDPFKTFLINFKECPRSKFLWRIYL